MNRRGSNNPSRHGLLKLAALACSLSSAVLAAPELLLERSDGTEVIRTGRVVTWGEQYYYTVPLGVAAFENVVSIAAVDGGTAAIKGDGSVSLLGFGTASDHAALAALTDVRCIAGNFYGGVAAKSDGTPVQWRPHYDFPAGLTGVTALATGGYHMLALKANGTVAAWGENDFGQAVVPPGLSGVTAICSGGNHNVVVKSNGTVAAWGLNNLGQTNVPAGLTNVRAVAAGVDHSVALKSDGTLVGWGSNTYGQLTPPAGLGPVTAIAAAGRYTAALKSDGTVAVWGHSDQSSVPTVPSYIGQVSAICPGGGFYMAAITHRPIEAYAGVGLRTGSTKTFTLRNTGTDPLNLGAILNTGSHASDFVVDSSGLAAVLAPGESTAFSVTFTPPVSGLRSTVLKIPNDDPDEGDWDFALTGYAVNTPPVAGNLEIEMLEDTPGGVEFDMPAMDPNGDAMTFTIDTGGNYDLIFEPLGGKRYRVRSTKDFHGQKTFRFIADDHGIEWQPATGYLTISVIPVNDPPVLTVPAGTITAMQASPDGTPVHFMVGAGDAEDGLLQPVMTVNGNPVTSGDLFPVGESLVEVSVTDSGGATVTKSFSIRVVVSAAMTLEESGVELKERLLLTTRGANSSGQTTIPSGVSEVIAITAGEDQSIIVQPDGTVRSWGAGYNGLSTVPAGLSGVVEVSTGGYHALARKSDGTLVGWGYNGNGQATPPPGLTGVIAIAAGRTHSLAVKSDGTVVAWGSSTRGETAVPVGLDQVVEVAAGLNCSLALRRNGSVVGWGEGYFGEESPPSWLAGVIGITVGERHCLAWRSDGTLVGWGSNESGISTAPAGLGPVVFAAAGARRSTVILPDGKVMDWGFFTSLPPTTFTNVKEMVWGESHLLAVEGAPALCSWGSTTAFTPAPKVLTIRNSGTAPLNVSGISVEGGLPGEFVPDTGAMDSSLAPGESTSFALTFSPKAPGLRQATLRIASNEGAGETREVKLSGTWVNLAPVVSAVGPLSLDEDQPGGIEITLPANDPNGNPLSLVIVSPPPAAQGTLGPLVGNKVVFTPAPDFHGASSFTFKANDGFVDSNVATASLSVSPVNDPPRLTFPASPVIVQTLSPDGSVAEFIATALDAEEGWLNPVLTVNGVPVASSPIFPMGDTEVVITATDLSGLTTTASFIVRVVSGPKMTISETVAGVLPEQTRVFGWGRNSAQQTTTPASVTGATGIAAGDSFSLALRPDGTVAAWGSNTYEQISVPAGLSNGVALCAGAFHSVALKGDGTVVAWGANSYDQATVPAGLGNVVAIDAGDYFTLALLADGTVVGWGRNTSGQISIPAGLSDVAAISAGSSHSIAVKRDGTVVAWGSNTSGEATVPAGLSGIKAVGAGGNHSIALRRDGTVVAWGSNTYGQITVPAALGGVKEISAGTYHNLALTQDRRVVAWGRNSDGQATVPADPGRVEAISAGGSHSLALGAKAPVVDFGIVPRSSPATTTLTLRNDGPADLAIAELVLTSGHTGDFTVQGGNPGLLLESGESSSFDVIFSPSANGPRRAILTVRSNNTGNPAMQVALTGHGRNGSPVATALSGISVAEDAVAGVTITLAASDPENDALSYRIVSSPQGTGSLGPVTGNQVTFFPAFNYHGQAGFSFVANDAGSDSAPAAVAITVTPVNDPPWMTSPLSTFRVTTPLSGGTPVYFRPPSISDYEDGILTPTFRLNNGTVVASGAVFPVGNTTVTVRGTDSGGLSISTSFVINVASVTAPALQLESPAGAILPRPPAVVSWIRNSVSPEIPPELRGVKEIAAGFDHGLALRHDGTIFGWGTNGLGQQSVPSGLLTATKLRSGTDFAMALRSNGTVVAWGSNASGQATVPGTLAGVTDIAAGSSHAVACKSDGTVVAWGINGSGQTIVPAGLTGVTAVAAGNAHTLALKSDGTVIGWGSNTYGQRTIPAGLNSVSALAAGANHSLALKADGTVVAWGRSSEGQIHVPPGLGNVTAISAGNYHSMALKADGSVAAWGSYELGSPIAALPSQATRAHAIASGLYRPMAAVDHPSALNLGTGNTGGQLVRSITVRNRGTAGLNLAGITRTEGSEDFTVQTSAMSASVATGQTTGFIVSFNPTRSGPQSARFRIASNDRYEATFDFVVSGEGVPPFLAWAATAGLGESGVDPEAAPHGDGVASLLKYAFNLNGSGPDVRQMIPVTGTAGLPSVTLENGMLRIEFVRRKSGDLIYTATRSPSLSATSFLPTSAVPVVTDIDSTWERVVIREAVDLAVTPKLFGRVEVRMK